MLPIRGRHAGEAEKPLLPFKSDDALEVDDARAASQHQHEQPTGTGWSGRRWLRVHALLTLVLVMALYAFRRQLNLVERERSYVAQPVSPFNASALVEPFPHLQSGHVYSHLQSRWQLEGFPTDTLDCPALTADERRRFATELIDRSNINNKTTGKVYIALNLYNNVPVIPSLAKAIFEVAAFFGPENVGVSIFENGSADGTALSIAHLARALDAMHIRNSVLTDPTPTDWSQVDRLVQLAYYRNIVLDAFLDSEYDTILFVNDVFVCQRDMLELLYQRKVQQATATCGLDFVAKKEPYAHGRAIFYDDWVTRSLSGRPIRPRFDPSRRWIDTIAQLFSDPGERAYRDLFRAGMPVPVYSCWNGMIALDARPFNGVPIEPSPSSTIEADADDRTPLRFRAADRDSGECRASECSIVAKDLWRRSFDRFVLVPAVRATYEKDLYHDPQLVGLASSATSASKGEAIGTEDRRDELIDWTKVDPPERVTCWPWKTRAHVDFWFLAEYEPPI